MKKFIFSVSAAILILPHTVTAQEAFVAQVGDTGIRVTTQTPQAIVLSDIVNVSTRMPTTAPDLSGVFDAYPLPDAATTAAYVNVVQSGNSNASNVFQDGLQSALVIQSGSANTASISQTGGDDNIAAVYQRGSNATAIVSQTGSGNRALTVQ